MSQKKTPAWKQNQQKETKPKNREERKEEVQSELIKIRMNTDYRDVAKRGDIYETDAEKAEELVRLGRAEYLPEAKKSPKKAAGEGSQPQEGQESTTNDTKGDDDGNDKDTGEASE